MYKGKAWGREREREVIYQNGELNKNLSRGQCSCVLSTIVASQCSNLDPLLYEIQVPYVLIEKMRKNKIKEGTIDFV